MAAGSIWYQFKFKLYIDFSQKKGSVVEERPFRLRLQRQHMSSDEFIIGFNLFMEVLSVQVSVRTNKKRFTIMTENFCVLFVQVRSRWKASPGT